MTSLTSGEISIIDTTKILFQFYGQNSKPFFKTIIRIFKLLKIIFGASLGKTPITNWKKSITRYCTLALFIYLRKV